MKEHPDLVFWSHHSNLLLDLHSETVLIFSRFGKIPWFRCHPDWGRHWIFSVVSENPCRHLVQIFLESQLCMWANRRPGFLVSQDTALGTVSALAVFSGCEYHLHWGLVTLFKGKGDIGFQGSVASISCSHTGLEVHKWSYKSSQGIRSFLVLACISPTITFSMFSYYLQNVGGKYPRGLELLIAHFAVNIFLLCQMHKDLVDTGDWLDKEEN